MIDEMERTVVCVLWFNSEGDINDERECSSVQIGL